MGWHSFIECQPIFVHVFSELRILNYRMVLRPSVMIMP